ncbi:hypothetical protein [Actinomadura verrucosospora]|uniref:Secreted protein n=1 Tax=Actinomadura verrucosospora TaxID=46165 RepID=A0A7D3VZ07_ACTVE|nr:hypothetical protein [Actinomadura verrucosospora]QKG22411.1 hypothetical protein ACTIVE_4051 [Actinomadura verrucosospora]
MAQRKIAVAAAALAAAGALGGGTAMAQEGGRPAIKESHVTGDAWLKYPGDPQTPYRRFIVDAHGGPWKFVNGKMVMGDARGTVRFDHFAPDTPGGPSTHHWGTIKVDYLMASGPVAVVSGIRQDDEHGIPPNQKRANLTFYQSPRGHRYDRMGFSWGLVFPQCQQMGSGPAPFSPASAGPDGRWMKGYTVKAAPMDLPTGEIQSPDNPPDCSFGHE